MSAVPGCELVTTLTSAPPNILASMPGTWNASAVNRSGFAVVHGPSEVDVAGRPCR